MILSIHNYCNVCSARGCCYDCEMWIFTQSFVKVGDVGVQNSRNSSNSRIEEDAWVLVDSMESSRLFSRRHGLLFMLWRGNIRGGRGQPTVTGIPCLSMMTVGAQCPNVQSGLLPWLLDGRQLHTECDHRLLHSWITSILYCSHQPHQSCHHATVCRPYQYMGGIP